MLHVIKKESYLWRPLMILVIDIQPNFQKIGIQN